MHRIAWALCAGLAATSLAVPANADTVTYTWQTQSSVPPGNSASAPTLTLSFAVDGPVSFAANSHFADNSFGGPPATQVAYPFPAALTAFSLYVSPPPIPTFASPITLSDFVSPQSSGVYTGFPQWSFALTADPSSDSASLSLFYLDPLDSFQFNGPPAATFNPAQLSTSALGTIDFGSDAYPALEPAQYTGILVASPAVPEPRSAWLLLAGIAMLGLVSRFCARRARP